MVLPLPRRERELEIEASGSQYIVHDRKHDYVHVLNKLALDVLEQCDGLHTYDQIAKTLCSRSHEPYERVASEVAHLVAAFADLALVESAAVTA